MHRLADRVRIRRIQIFPLFEDYDRVHNGTVSRFQFHRVLSELDLGSLVSAREFLVIKKKFDVVLGYKHDFNYIGFCDLINEYANFEHGKPWTQFGTALNTTLKLFWGREGFEANFYLISLKNFGQPPFLNVNNMYFIQQRML